MDSVEKERRGGARPGAGRKPTGRQYHVMSVTGTKEELDEIRRKAAFEKKSISRYLIELALRN